MNVVLSLLALVIVVAAGAAPAFAYVGPGAGLSLIGAFWGLLVAIFAAFGFVILWPLRRMMRRRRGSPGETAPPANADVAADPALQSERRGA